jgi:hypothetical protein
MERINIPIEVYFVRIEFLLKVEFISVFMVEMGDMRYENIIVE